ncbi:MAG: BhlA/UviB family holin-like peptide [Tissierellaceae bacterium]|nr:BhlA/UviB family holin-like peptide [Tissierellaceae bacterium]
MEQELFKLAAGNSLWAALFVSLFLYTIYDSRHREKQYQTVIHENQNIIKELSVKFGVVEDIQSDVSYIKDELKRR